MAACLENLAKHVKIDSMQDVCIKRVTSRSIDKELS